MGAGVPSVDTNTGAPPPKPGNGQFIQGTTQGPREESTGGSSEEFAPQSNQNTIKIIKIIVKVVYNN